MFDDLPYSTAKIVGGHEDQTWAQVATLQPFSYTETNNLGTLTAVVQITRTDAEDAAFFGKSLLDTVQNAYFAKQSDTIVQALERAFAQATEALQHEHERLEAATILLCVPTKEHLYLVGTGDGTITLFRNGQLTPIISQQHPQVIVGTLHMHDYLILGSNSFYEHAYPTQEVFDGNNDAHEIADILSPLLLSLPQNGDIAAFIVAKTESVAEAPAVLPNNQPTHEAQPSLDSVSAPTPNTAPPIPHTAAVPSEHEAPQPALVQPPLNQSIPSELQTAAPAVPPPVTAEVVPQQQAAPYQSNGVHPLESMATSYTAPMHDVVVHAPEIKNQKTPILYVLREKKLLHPSMMVRRARQTSFPISKRAVLRIVIVIIVFGGVAAAILAFRHHQRVQQLTKTAALYTQAQQLLSQTNAIVGNDPKQAAVLLQQAKQAEAAAKSTDAAYPEPDGLSQGLADASNKILAISAVQDPQTLIDLNLIKESFAGDKLAYTDAAFIAVDPKAPTILLLDKTNHNGTIASGGAKLPNFISAATLNDTILALGQDAVYTVDSTTGNAKQLIAKDTSWDTLSDIATYNGNIYLLDSKKGQIWKYEASGNGFGQIKNVLDTDQTVLATSQTRMVIDGVIWLTGPNGIVMVEQGKSQRYSISGLPEPLGAAIHLTTTPQTQNLYILDSQHKRIVVATKDGRYVNEFTSSSFGNATDITLDQTDNKLYLLTNTKVLQIPIANQ